jgi:hypothetical protein
MMEGLKKGVKIHFHKMISDYEQPYWANTATVERVAKDKSWIDISSFWGRKRIPVTDDNFRIINQEEYLDVHKLQESMNVSLNKH